ncbi:MAG: menaquinone-specific isochorismate synthase [Myxococcota bacterium]|jgi:menaquinone-specific isochorismate synthase
MIAARTPEQTRRRDLRTTRLPNAPTWSKGWTAISDAVARLGRANVAMHRFEVRFGALVEVDPLAWISAQPAGTRLYWADRDHTLEVAGVGVADRVEAPPAEADTALNALSSWLRHGGTQARYFGHLTFGDTRAHAECGPNNADGAGDAEDAAAGLRLTLPRVEVGRDTDGAWLAVHVIDGRPPVDLGATPGMASLAAQSPEIVSRSCEPAHAGWCASVTQALEAIDSAKLRKVVLARASTLVTATPVEPTALLGRVAARDPSTFRFLLEHGPGDAFVGASPERLYRRDGRRVECDALAGTRPRGMDRTLDDQLAAELLGSAKDRAEQAVVTEAITALLTPLGPGPVTTEAPTVRRFAHVQHLWSPIRATLGASTEDGTLLTALHPTPAVCGTPTREARAMLSTLEHFPRVHYAAPLGWIGASGAEFAVGLRAVRIRGHRLTLFAGAGIVSGSVPEAEWDELDAKDFGTLAALGATL